MISKEDYDFIAAFDSSDAKTRENKLKENPHQAAKTFLNLLGHVSKDQTIQYILTMIDDMLQVAIQLLFSGLEKNLDVFKKKPSLYIYYILEFY